MIRVALLSPFIVDLMLGVIGGDEARAHRVVGHFVAGRDDVFAVVAEHDERRFLSPLLRRGDKASTASCGVL